MTHTNAATCQCEHAAHFPTSVGGRGPEFAEALAPAEHRYGTSSDRLEDCRTSMGTFALCAPCRNVGHLSLADAQSKPVTDLRSFWLKAREAIANERELPADKIEFVSATRFDRVYQATPDHVGELRVSYALRDAETRGGSAFDAHAIYGVTADARVTLYMD